MLDLLRAIRDRSKTVPELVEEVRRLNRVDLLTLYAECGIGPPINNPKCQLEKTPGEWADVVPVEIHAAILVRLWPKEYRVRRRPKKRMIVLTAKDAVDVMEARAEAGYSIWHPADQVEITDRKRIFHRQMRSRDPGELTRRKKKSGGNKIRPTLSKMEERQVKYWGDDYESDEECVRRFIGGHAVPKLGSGMGGLMRGEEEERFRERGEAIYIPQALHPKNRAQKAKRKITGKHLAAKLKAMRANHAS